MPSSDPIALHKLSRATCSLKTFVKELDCVMAPFELQDDLYVHPQLSNEFVESNTKYQQRIAAGLKSAEDKRLQANSHAAREVAA